MKIAYISPYFSIGGTEEHILQLISSLKRRHEIILLTTRGEDERVGGEIKLIHFPFLKGRRIISGLPGVIKGLKKLSKYNPDLVHVHAGAEFLLLSKLSGIRAPLVFTCHGYIRSFDYFTSAFLCNLFADKVIAVSRAERNFLLKKGLRKEKIKVIWHGIEKKKLNKKKVEELKAHYGIGNRKVVLGAVGRLSKEKGIPLLLKAVSSLSCQNILLMFLGGGDKKVYFQGLAKKLHLEEKTVFTGFVPDVENYLKLFDIFISSSLKESFGLSILEAMSMGKPILAADIAPLREIVGEGGLFFKKGSILDLRDKLSYLIEDRPLRENLARKAELRFKNFFQIKDMVEKTEAVYKKLIRL